MVRDAPTFADVAHHVASRVDGAVVAEIGCAMRLRAVREVPHSTQTGATPAADMWCVTASDAPVLNASVKAEYGE
jgi:hypothetical protein